MVHHSEYLSQVLQLIIFFSPCVATHYKYIFHHTHITCMLANVQLVSLVEIHMYCITV